MIHSRQIANFAQTHPYVSEYLNQSQDPFWRKYDKCFYVYTYTGSTDYTEEVTTMYKNTLFYQAHKTMARRYPELFTDPFKTPYIQIDSVNICGISVEIKGNARIDISGQVTVTLEIGSTTIFYFDKHRENGYMPHMKVFYPKSIAWNKEAVQEYIAAILKAHLPGNGVFSSYMLSGYTREQLLAAIQRRRLEATNPQAYDEGEILTYFKRRYNIEIGWNVTVATFIKFCRQLKASYPKLMKLEKYDYSQFDHIDSDIDELENEYWNSFEEDTIYI